MVLPELKLWHGKHMGVLAIHRQKCLAITHYFMDLAYIMLISSLKKAQILCKFTEMTIFV